MKKRQVVLYIFVAMLMLLATSAYATISGELDFKAYDNKFYPGKEFIITVGLKNLETTGGIKSVEGYIDIDENVLEPLTVENIVTDENGKVKIGTNNTLNVYDAESISSAADNAIILNTNPVSGKGDYKLVIDLGSPISSSTDLVSIKFKIKNDIELKEYQSAMSYKLFKVFSADASEKLELPNQAFTITVSEAPEEVKVSNITFNKNNLSLYVGDTETLVATVSPSNATNKTLTWTTNKPEVATVTNGKITAVAAGEATITATSADGDVTAICTVTVSEKQEEPENPDPTEVDVTAITLNKSKLSLDVGDVETLIATISPSNATNKSITWTSSKTSVATVSNGKVTAKAAGTATITATSSNGKKATCTVTVSEKQEEPSEVKVTSVSLNKSKLSLYVGDVETLTVTISPSNAIDKSVTWTSSNTSVATVSNGKITAKAAGTTTITVTTENGKKATCSVTVSKKNENSTNGRNGSGSGTSGTGTGTGTTTGKDATTSPTNLPKTGYRLMLVPILAIVVVGFVFYKKYSKYNIKG